MGLFRDEGVCIRVWDWSETSQTVAILSRQHGMIRAVARGSKRPKSPFSGGLEILTRAELSAFAKPGAELANLASWDLLEVFRSLRTTLRAHRAGMFLADLTRHLVTDPDPHPEIYATLVNSLRAIDQDQPIAVILARFQWIALGALGYRPEIERDVRTGSALPDSATLAFCPELGGLVPDTPAGRRHAPGPVWRVRASTVAALRTMAREEEIEIDIDADAAIGAVRLLWHHIHHTLAPGLMSIETALGLDSPSPHPDNR